MRLSQNKTVIFNILSTALLQALTFITTPVFSESLGTSNFGIASVYYTWVCIVSTVFSLQTGSAVSVAKSAFPASEQKKFQSSALSLAIFSYSVLSVFSLIIIYAIRDIVKIDYLMVAFVLLNGFGMYCVYFMNYVYIYEFKADRNLLLTVITSISTIVFSIILIRRIPYEINYWGRIVGQAIPYTIIGIVVCFIVFSQGRTLYRMDYWKFILPITVPTVFHTISSMVLSQSDRIMLQKQMTNSATGIYSLAATFSGVMHSIWAATNNSWCAFYYEYTKENEIDKIRIHGKNYIELFTVLTCGFILLTPEVYHIFAGSEYWSGMNIIPIYTIGYFCVFLYSFPANYEFYNKKTKMIATATSVAAIVNIVLNYYLISWIGILGAAMSTAFSYLLQFCLHFKFAKKIKDMNFPFMLSDFYKGIFLVMIAVIMFYIPIPWIIRWVVAICIGTYEITKILKRRSIF